MTQAPTHPRRAPRRPAFTLTEVLVVITIVVLMLAMAVPLFNVFSTGRSIDAAENLVSAALQRARARAIGLQEPRGVFFFADPVTANVGMVTVMTRPEFTTGTGAVPLELDVGFPDTEPLPTGIGAAFLGANASPASTSALTAIEYRPLGLVLFDAYGRVQTTRFTVPKTSDLAIRTGLATVPTAIPDQFSQVALNLYEKRLFADAVGSQGDPAQTLVFTATGTPIGQAQWLNQNGQGIVVNRYNGTLFRAE